MTQIKVNIKVTGVFSSLLRDKKGISSTTVIPYMSRKGETALKYTADTLFSNIGDAASKGALIAIIAKAKTMFKISMSMVPIDTGKTANSGRLTVGNMIVGTGKVINAKEGIAVAEYNDGFIKILNSHKYDIYNFGKSIDVHIGFQRFDDITGESVIEKIHELGPLGSRSVHARQEGKSGHFVLYPFLTQSTTLVHNVVLWTEQELKTLEIPTNTNKR